MRSTNDDERKQQWYPTTSSCSSVGKRTAGSWLCALAATCAAALCSLRLGLLNVGSPAPTRLLIVLLCLLTRWHSATRQPDPKLHSVGGRRLLDAALELAFDGCHAAACGSRMSARA